MRRFLVWFISIVLISSLLIFATIDKIIAFTVNHFTDYTLTYSRWGKNIFDKSEVYDFFLKSNDGVFSLDAEKARVGFSFSELFKQKKLIITLSMEGVLLASKSAKVSMDDPLSIPFSPDEKYKEMKLILSLGTDVIEIMDFNAYSKDVKMDGNCKFTRKKNDINVYFKISFSPEISSAFDPDIRKNVLSLDEDGWYSTVISYKGNALFLKALYSLAVPE